MMITDNNERHSTAPGVGTWTWDLGLAIEQICYMLSLANACVLHIAIHSSETETIWVSISYSIVRICR
jgi:hypothetical protein